MINEDIRHIIEPELAEGEEFLWAANPKKHSFILLTSAIAMPIILGAFFIIPTLVALITGNNSVLNFDFNGSPAKDLSDPWLSVPLLIFVLISTFLYSFYCFYLSKRIGFSRYAITHQFAYILRPNKPVKLIQLSLDKYNLAIVGTKNYGSIYFINKFLNPIIRLFTPIGSFFHPVFFKIQEPENVLKRLQTLKAYTHEQTN